MSLARAARIAALGATTAGVALLNAVDAESETFAAAYRHLIKPALFLLDAETAHRVAVHASAWRLLPKQHAPDPPVLRTTLWQREVCNPIGVAAGFDKDAEAFSGLFASGFGAVEVGSITPLPQPGNPKPRVFRLYEDDAVINRYGFNSRGHAEAEQRLAARRSTEGSAPRLLGVNLGKNKTSDDPTGDYCKGVRALGRYADYLVVNVSSPNTPGLRDLQRREVLQELLTAVRKEVELLPTPRPPLVLKVAPDLNENECADIAAVALAARVDGIIVSNTTVARPASLKSKHAAEAGGLSGRPLFEPSTEVLRELYSRTGGKITLIGTGGISSGRDAYEKIRAGASAVQLYTSLVFEGLPLLPRIKRELAELLIADGFDNVNAAVGSGAGKASGRSK